MTIRDGSDIIYKSFPYEVITRKSLGEYGTSDTGDKKGRKH